MSGQYVIVSPVYNEAKVIERTILSVLEQTLLPARWVIVNDGSSDSTAQILDAYAAAHSWIEVIHKRRTSEKTYYASNVRAINDGVSRVDDVQSSYLAILDGDLQLPETYYAELVARMERDPALGIASGVYVDRMQDGTIRKVLNDRRSTPKGLSFFRWDCYRKIGGFVPLENGFEDTCACYTARMLGWTTWSFPDLIAVHNKPVGTGHSSSAIKSRFRLGVGEYFAGSHPLFALLKSLRRCVLEKPRVIGGLARLCGYTYAWAQRRPFQISNRLVQYVRHEQLRRIRSDLW